MMKNRIKELREKENVSQGDVAQAINVARYTVNQYETGRWVPTPETWDKLADYFDVSIEYLQGYPIYQYGNHKTIECFPYYKNKCFEKDKAITKSKIEKRNHDKATMNNLYKSFDIPKGLTGKINDFRGLFNKKYLEHHGFHVKTVKCDMPVSLLIDHYYQYSIDTVKGEFIIGKNKDATKDQPLVTYLGNGKWDIPEKVSDKDEGQKKVSSK